MSKTKYNSIIIILVMIIKKLINEELKTVICFFSYFHDGHLIIWKPFALNDIIQQSY